MRCLKLLLILPALLVIFSAHADQAQGQADGTAAAPLPTGVPPKKTNPPARVERPKREAVKLSPGIHRSPPRPDDSGKMRRVAPPREDSPLQNVPALKQPPSGGEAPNNR